jgi:hypothetical protein
MSRRATTTHRSDAHDATKDLLKSGAERIRGRHRAQADTPVDAHHLPGAAPRQRTRKPRPTTPKM